MFMSNHSFVRLLALAGLFCAGAAQLVHAADESCAVAFIDLANPTQLHGVDVDPAQTDFSNKTLSLLLAGQFSAFESAMHSMRDAKTHPDYRTAQRLSEVLRQCENPVELYKHVSAETRNVTQVRVDEAYHFNLLCELLRVAFYYSIDLAVCFKAAEKAAVRNADAHHAKMQEWIAGLASEARGFFGRLATKWHSLNTTGVDLYQAALRNVREDWSSAAFNSMTFVQFVGEDKKVLREVLHNPIWPLAAKTGTRFLTWVAGRLAGFDPGGISFVDLDLRDQRSLATYFSQELDAHDDAWFHATYNALRMQVLDACDQLQIKTSADFFAKFDPILIINHLVFGDSLVPATADERRETVTADQTTQATEPQASTDGALPSQDVASATPVAPALVPVEAVVQEAAVQVEDAGTQADIAVSPLPAPVEQARQSPVSSAVAPEPSVVQDGAPETIMIGSIPVPLPTPVPMQQFMQQGSSASLPSQAPVATAASATSVSVSSYAAVAASQSTGTVKRSGSSNLLKKGKQQQG